MIYANINTYVGMCGDAEHYYCQYVEKDGDAIPNTMKVYGGDDLKYEIRSSNACREYNKKDSTSRWHIGMETNRFFSKIINIFEKKLFKYAIWKV